MARKAIPSGVLIYWPCFGAHLSDSRLFGHGSARAVVPWEVVSTITDVAGVVAVELTLASPT